MNASLVLSTIRQLLSQPVRLGALGGVFVLPLLQIAVDSEPRVGGHLWAMFAAVVATAGVIGVETSSGSLALFLVRPMTRAKYFFSRWCGALAVALFVASAGLAGEAVVVITRHGELSAAGVAFAALDRLLVVVGVVSVMACFSALAPSVADLLIWGSVNVLAMSLTAAGTQAQIKWLMNVGHALSSIGIPVLDVDRLLIAASIPWAAITGYASVVILALGCAIVGMNRKELSYASE